MIKKKHAPKLANGGVKRSISFSFQERFYNGNEGYEMGYYKATRTADGKTNVFYGKFEVILRKKGGKWKIWVDGDVPVEDMTDEKFFAGEIVE